MKDIPGFEERYAVTEDGKVWSYPKYPLGKGKWLKTDFIKGGYLRVRLYIFPDIVCRCLVHRLVALTYIKNPDNKPYVNHINGNKTDNRASNLEWCTAKENSIHASKTGLLIATTGENQHMSKLDELKVRNIRKLRKHGLTHKKISEIYNVTESLISQVCRMTIWKHVD